MTVIDLSPQLEEIRLKYPAYWRSADALRELQALWGNATCNECGVLPADEEITIELQPQWTASVKIARAPNGWYAFALSYAYGSGGAGAAVSVWNDTAYTTRQETLEAGIHELKRIYLRLRDCQNFPPETQKTNAARMIALLDQHLTQSRQLSLF
jgi:hypothetical protein